LPTNIARRSYCQPAWAKERGLSLDHVRPLWRISKHTALYPRPPWHV